MASPATKKAKTDSQHQLTIMESFKSSAQRSNAATKVDVTGAGKVPPGDGKVAPGDGKVAPGDGKVAPGDGKVPPGDGKVPPGDGKVPPGDVIEILDDEISSPEIGEFPSSPLQSPLSPSSSELVVPALTDKRLSPHTTDSVAGPNPLTQSKITLGHHHCDSSKSRSATDLPTSQGSALSEICFGPSAYPLLSPLRACSTHSVLFRPRLKQGVPPRPFPDTFKDIWDSNHVRMPCSLQSLYPITLDSGEKKLLPRWDLVTDALRKPVTNSYDLQEAIMTYNSRYSRKWDFRGLHSYFNEVCDETESATFFHSIFPKIVDLALDLPNIVTHAVPLLRKQQNYSTTFTQQQIACLLANAFLCTFPRRNTNQSGSEYAKYPSINFNSLFISNSRNTIDHVKANKLKSILHYFTRVVSHVPEGTVTFTRQVLSDVPVWEKCEANFTKLHIDSAGNIEDNGHGMLQVDFANKFIGGGVLGHGCVQEEIRFLISPELIVSRLFTEELDGNESLTITGAERFSSYRGYGSGFEWSNSYIDDTVRDTWGRRQTQITAIDALVVYSHKSQFKPGVLRRELNKAYCGFRSNDSTPCGHGTAVATGNWGCGAFGGDPRLKALLQLMAAAVAERDVVYFTFGDRELQEDFFSLHRVLVEGGVTVCRVWSALLRYYNEVVVTGAGRLLYEYIMTVVHDAGRSKYAMTGWASTRSSGITPTP